MLLKLMTYISDLCTDHEILKNLNFKQIMRFQLIDPSSYVIRHILNTVKPADMLPVQILVIALITRWQLHHGRNRSSARELLCFAETVLGGCIDRFF